MTNQRVCRVEFEHMDRPGTAFLVAPTLALTSYHILDWTGHEALEANAGDLRLRFGVVTEGAGGKSTGQAFKLAKSEPVPKFSPTKKLDYALLRIDDAITLLQDSANPIVTPVPLCHNLPAKGDGLHILQHPGGDALKLAISVDGIDRVLVDRGLVQYSTPTKGGSSGSPAFNDDWEVVALHSRERSVSFGSIREGSLLSSILEEIEQFL